MTSSLVTAVVIAALLAPWPAKGEDDAWDNASGSIRDLGQKVQLASSDDDDSGSSERKARRHRAARKGNAQQEGSAEKRGAVKDKDNEDDQDDDDASSQERPRSRWHKAAPTPTPEAEASPESTPKEPPKSSREESGSRNTEGTGAQNHPTQVSSLAPEALRDYARQPAKVQELIRESLALTSQNLGYMYGSADPAKGGMDCSGFIYYVLQRAGFRDVPRDSSEQYLWVRKKSDFHAVLSRRQDTFELQDLRPGDLLFWSGTYNINRDVPITHVMIYLGAEKKTGHLLMVGASDGRSYNGEAQYGVSVFDFKLPSGQPSKEDPCRTPRFQGYATIPGVQPAPEAAPKEGSEGAARPRSAAARGKSPPDEN